MRRKKMWQTRTRIILFKKKKEKRLMVYIMFQNEL